MADSQSISALNDTLNKLLEKVRTMEDKTAEMDLSALEFDISNIRTRQDAIEKWFMYNQIVTICFVVGMIGAKVVTSR
jgi:hypothetical protein